MYFSIAAPQAVTVPSPAGPIVLDFRVNPADTSLVEIHVIGADKDGIDGAHILTFKRNGGAQDQTFVPVEKPAPLAGYKSVDDDAVRDPPLKDYVASAGYPKDDGTPKQSSLGTDIPGTPVPMPPVPETKVNTTQSFKTLVDPKPAA